MKEIVIVGYGGHSYVVLDILAKLNRNVLGYYDNKESKTNPYKLKFLGSEKDIKRLPYDYFVSIGDNHIREKVNTLLFNLTNEKSSIIIDPSASVSNTSKLSPGVLVGPNAAINALAKIGEGVICNTGCIIEHECEVGNYSHIGPGAILAGNVTIGVNSFVGANSVIKEGVIIGNNTIIGAGSVIINDIGNNETVVGNPGKNIRP